MGQAVRCAFGRTFRALQLATISSLYILHGPVHLLDPQGLASPSHVQDAA